MHVIAVKCPLCGTPVRAPNARPHNRLHCRKCHTPFHLNKAGRAVIGEPPDVEQDLAELKQTLRDFRDRIPTRRIAAGAAAVLVAWLMLSYLFGPSEDLAQVAEGAARAVAENDEDYLRSIAAPGTSEEVARWFEQAHRRLVEQRKHWYAKDEKIEVHVASVDPTQGKGVVGVSIHPSIGTARDVSLADPAAATASAASPCDLETVWVQDWRGRWMLDGHDTGAKPQPAP